MEINPLQRSVTAADIAPERLAGSSSLSEHQKIAEASRQFEAILLKQILDASQKTVIHSKLADTSTSSGIYHDMITNQLADSISKSGAFGLSQTFERQLDRQNDSAAKVEGAFQDATPASGSDAAAGPALSRPEHSGRAGNQTRRPLS